MFTVGSLFSGIGGFDLGLERAGMRTAWFVEQDEFCQRVLAKHWPGVPCYPDVARLKSADVFRRHGYGQPVPAVDVLCGGFPCQDISLAGAGAGIDGERSGLWSEYARLIRELRPRYVVVENVAALLARGMGRVLGDLAACGYDAEWDCLPASAFGAPHRRDRVWLIAYPASDGRGQGRQGGSAGDGADGKAVPTPRLAQTDQGRAVDDAMRGRHGAPQEPVRAGRDGSLDSGWWKVEPSVGRVANGVPARVDRLRSLGNALVPQIAELIGRRILEWEARSMREAA